MPVRGGRGSGAEVLMATEGQRSPVPPRAVAVSKQDSLVGKRACSSGRTPRLPSLSASTGAEACRRPEVLLPPGNTGAFPLCVRLRHLQRSHVVTAKPPVSRPTGEAQVSRALSLVLKQESGTREESTCGGSATRIQRPARGDVPGKGVRGWMEGCSHQGGTGALLEQGRKREKVKHIPRVSEKRPSALSSGGL